MTPIQLWFAGMTAFVGFVVFTPHSAEALDCYVCRDCEQNFNSSHVVQCSKSSARCVKIVNENGVVDRTCGDAAKCGGRESGFQFPAPTQRPRRAAPVKSPSRQKRALLEGPTQKQQGFKELSALHCCNENECNGSPSQFTSFISSLTSFFLALFLSRI